MANQYYFGFKFGVTEQVKPGVRVTRYLRTQIEAFSVRGGIERYFWTDARNGYGDADLMSDFYQARQFNNITIQKFINRESLEIDKVYYLKLPFEFTFEVISLSTGSRFKGLQLSAKDGRIKEPPNRDSKSEALVVEFSKPTILYFHEVNKGSAKSIAADVL